MSELILTDQSFDQEVLQATVPVLVDFGRRGVGRVVYKGQF